MEKFEKASVEPLGEVRVETSIDTQIEVDLISGGVGFDDSPTDDKWLRELREKQKRDLENNRR